MIDNFILQLEIRKKSTGFRTNMTFGKLNNVHICANKQLSGDFRVNVLEMTALYHLSIQQIIKRLD